jgi:hypothetical protein
MIYEIINNLIDREIQNTNNKRMQPDKITALRLQFYR